ncbi:MAG: SPOR domain-containing protein [Bacteroidetes bacterium]|jgi:hypothetical protein|nr:SPOR domain-containing protein [Bacteroidota bacterium]
MKLNFLKLFFIIALISGPLLAQEGVVNINKSEAIDRLIELKKEANKEINFNKIQIYSGPRAGAEQALSSFRSFYSDYSSEMKYETPNYKIWVGNFRTKIEADRALVAIKKKYPYAFIFTPKKS